MNKRALQTLAQNIIAQTYEPKELKAKIKKLKKQMESDFNKLFDNGYTAGRLLYDLVLTYHKQQHIAQMEKADELRQSLNGNLLFVLNDRVRKHLKDFSEAVDKLN